MILIGEEIGEGFGEEMWTTVKELEDEAHGAHAELDCGDGVVALASEVGTPFDVEADEEGTGEVGGGFDGGDPGGGDGWVGGDGGFDLVVLEGDVVEVVVWVLGAVRYGDPRRRRHWWWL